MDIKECKNTKFIWYRRENVKNVKKQKRYDTAEYDSVTSWITKAKVRMACHQKIWDYNFMKTQNKEQMTWFKEHEPKISIKHTK